MITLQLGLFTENTKYRFLVLFCDIIYIVYEENYHIVLQII